MDPIVEATLCQQGGHGEGRLLERDPSKLTTDWCQAIDELRYALGNDAISTDDEDLLMHGYSEWSSINIDQLPVAVAYPKNTEDVSRIAKVCHKYKVPMSTSPDFLCMHTAPLRLSSSLFGRIEPGSQLFRSLWGYEHRLHFHGSDYILARRRVSENREPGPAPMRLIAVIVWMSSSSLLFLG